MFREVSGQGSVSYTNPVGKKANVVLRYSTRNRNQPRACHSKTSASRLPMRPRTTHTIRHHNTLANGQQGARVFLGVWMAAAAVPWVELTQAHAADRTSAQTATSQHAPNHLPERSKFPKLRRHQQALPRRQHRYGHINITITTTTTTTTTAAEAKQQKLTPKMGAKNSKRSACSSRTCRRIADAAPEADARRRAAPHVRVGGSSCLTDTREPCHNASTHVPNPPFFVVVGGGGGVRCLETGFCMGP